MRGAMAMAAVGAACVTAVGARRAAAADAPPPVPALTDAAAAEVAPPGPGTVRGTGGGTGDRGAGDRVRAPRSRRWSINGYVDVGFAKAQGDGTSFAPGDTRVPLDYGVDPFAPAVNSRGDAASTDPGRASGNPRFVNGFLPRSAGIGGPPSFLLNTAERRLSLHVAPSCR